MFGAATNCEGWAHYCEQMVIDEGFHADDPRYRLAQIQDALLRDARFIVGIRMHTQGHDACSRREEFFVKEGYQPRPSRDPRAKRGTSDATYGYYTMGKLMILKLRDDYKAKMGAQYSLQDFHDTFIRLGPLPLPLIRKAMLGDAGTLVLADPGSRIPDPGSFQAGIVAIAKRRFMRIPTSMMCMAAAIPPSAPPVIHAEQGVASASPANPVSQAIRDTWEGAKRKHEGIRGADAGGGLQLQADRFGPDLRRDHRARGRRELRLLLRRA